MLFCDFVRVHRHGFCVRRVIFESLYHYANQLVAFSSLQFIFFPVHLKLLRNGSLFVYIKRFPSGCRDKLTPFNIARVKIENIDIITVCFLKSKGKGTKGRKSFYSQFKNL